MTIRLKKHHCNHTADQLATRRLLPSCPACCRPWVDLGPPAKWDLCRRCPYKIVPAISPSSTVDAGGAGMCGQFSNDLRGIATRVADMAE